MRGRPRLVGREAEVEALTSLLRGPDELPVVALVVGEAGIGKTSVLDEAVHAAESNGFRVLRCRPAEAESRLAFVGLGDLLRDAGAAIAGLPGPQRRAVERALLLVDAEAGTPVDERAVALGFLGCLRALAEEGPLLIAADDVQWLDEPSLAALRFALGRLKDTSVAAALAARGEAPRWLPLEPDAVLSLDGLSIGALHHVLRSRLPRPPARRALVRIHTVSGGNPFYALELARSLERHGGALAPDGTLPIPDSLDELVAERLSDLSPDATAVACTAAALGEPDARLLAAVAPLEPGLDECVAAGVLVASGERVRFTHPLLASAVLRRMPARERRAVHARGAAVVEEPERRARHLALASTGPEEAVAAALDEASAHARARGAPGAAAELALLALELTPPETDAALRDRTVSAALLLSYTGDLDQAAALLNEALAVAPAATAAPLLQALAGVEFERSGPRRSIELLVEALSRVGDDVAVEAALHLGLADGFRFQNDLAAAEPHAAAAVRLAGRSSNEMLLAEALAMSVLIRFGLGRGLDRDAIDRAIALAGSAWTGAPGGHPRVTLGHTLFWSNRLDEARETLEGMLDEVGDDLPTTQPAWYLSLVEWRAGNWERATAHADHVLELVRLTSREALRAVTEWPRAVVAAHTGRVEDAEAIARASIAESEAQGVQVGVAGHLWLLGFLDLSRGDAAAALVQLRRSREIRASVGLREPGQQTELPDLLDALLTAGETAEAEQILDEWEPTARALDRAWALAIAGRHRALLLAARGDLGGALERFGVALADHARSIDPFQEARTRLALGATLRRAKQRSAARAAIGEALATFERLPAPLWAERAREELARIGGRTPSGDELTEAERRVVELVAAGRTNREAAAALFVTEHTVEAALTRAYRKLGVRSRAELAARFARES